MSGADKDPVTRRHVYGRTKGKTLKSRQTGLMQSLLPRISVPQGEEMLVLQSLFASPVKAVWLEVGFGGGEHLLWQATQNPDIGIIGCEPFVNGVARLIQSIAEKDPGNIRIHNDDAVFLLKRLPANSIARIFILYPDPWPKLRHKKRRFVNAETLALIANAMPSGGQLRFASDIEDYVRWTLDHVARFNASNGPTFEWQAESIEACRERPADWPQTRYELKALREGRVPAFLQFKRL